MFPTLSSLFAVAALLEGLLVFAALVASNLISRRSADALGEARADQTGVARGARHSRGRMRDWRASRSRRAPASVRFRVRALRACRCAMNAFLAAPGPALWSWGWRCAAGWAPVAHRCTRRREAGRARRSRSRGPHRRAPARRPLAGGVSRIVDGEGPPRRGSRAPRDSRSLSRAPRRAAFSARADR